jgi:hypothetical protein
VSLVPLLKPPAGEVKREATVVWFQSAQLSL